MKIVKTTDKTFQQQALDLALHVFMEFEAPDYPYEGTEEFKRSLQNPAYIDNLCYYIAIELEEVIGMLATRNKGSHIALLFVDAQWQRKGIGRKLIEVALEDCNGSTMTVNSAPFAHGFYKKAGFEDTDVEQLTNGIRYITMRNMKHEINIINIASQPQIIPNAVRWFAQKWNIPEEAYAESMQEALVSTTGVPSWIVVLNDDNKIIAGLGFIENDFHQRKDLTPNVCAVYVEEKYRHQGIARTILNYATDLLEKKGIKTCYLITEHTDFYEHCGWTFYGMIPENDGSLTRCYIKTSE